MKYAPAIAMNALSEDFSGPEERAARRARRQALADATDDLELVPLELLAGAAAVAVATSRQLPGELVAVEGHPRRHAVEDPGEHGPVALAGGEETKALHDDDLASTPQGVHRRRCTSSMTSTKPGQLSATQSSSSSVSGNVADGGRPRRASTWAVMPIR